MSEKKETKLIGFILDIVLVPVKHLKSIIAINILICTIAFLFFYYHKFLNINHVVLPDVYTSAARLILLDTNIPIEGEFDYINNSIMEAYTILGQRKSYDKLVIGLLQSNKIVDNIVLKLNELERDKDASIDAVTDISILRKVVLHDALFYFDDNGFLIITYTHKDPGTAKYIVDEFISQLERVYNELMLTKAKIKRQHIEERVKDVETKLSQARERFVRFQKEEGVILPDAEASALISSITELYNQIIASEIELEVIRELHIEKSREQKLEMYLTEKKKQLNQLLYGSGNKGSTGQILIPKYDIPDLTLKYLDLKRELAIQEALYNTLINQLEITRIEEKSELPILQVLDPPEISTRKSGPGRSMYFFMVAGMSIILSIGIAFYLEFLKKIKEDPGIAGKLELLKTRLSFRFFFEKKK